MDKNGNEMTNAVTQYALDMISIVIPYTAPTAGFVKNISDTILCQKLYQILMKQDDDFEEWLKLSENFQSESENYEKTVRQLIYTIESINEVDMLDMYANLLRAYKTGFISKDEFFRLSWILSNIFSLDLMYLKRCFGKKDMKECPELKRLEQFGLVHITRAPILMNAGQQNFHSITDLGKKMLSCGIDYENYDKYQEGNKH